MESKNLLFYHCYKTNYYVRNRKNLDSDLLENVISKMNKTHETLLKQDPPYLKDEEYNQLKQYVKVNPKKKT